MVAVLGGLSKEVRGLADVRGVMGDRKASTAMWGGQVEEEGHLAQLLLIGEELTLGNHYVGALVTNLGKGSFEDWRRARRSGEAIADSSARAFRCKWGSC